VKGVKADPQAEGSALTYARRYALMAMVGIAPEDDDGNAASKPAPRPAKKAQPVFDTAPFETAIAAATTADELAASAAKFPKDMPPEAHSLLAGQYKERLAELSGLTP
jgi:hypothetical protein